MFSLCTTSFFFFGCGNNSSGVRPVGMAAHVRFGGGRTLEAFRCEPRRKQQHLIATKRRSGAVSLYEYRKNMLQPATVDVKSISWLQIPSRGGKGVGMIAETIWHMLEL